MTWMQTASGRAADLVNPSPDQVDFTVDVPDALARLARFNGHVGSGPYSVAQHCCMGADALLAETGDEAKALAFLLHDAHEYVLGDDTTPKIDAMAAVAEEMMPGQGAALIRQVVRTLKHRHDLAIHRAAFGAGWSGIMGDHEVERAVKRMDLQMLKAERIVLLGPPPKPWHPTIEATPPAKFKGSLQPWPWAKAAEEWRNRFRRWTGTASFFAGPAKPGPGAKATTKPTTRRVKEIV